MLDNIDKDLVAIAFLVKLLDLRRAVACPAAGSVLEIER